MQIETEDLGKSYASVGYMVEDPHAYPELTVFENLEVARRLHHRVFFQPDGDGRNIFLVEVRRPEPLGIVVGYPLFRPPSTVGLLRSAVRRF